MSLNYVVKLTPLYNMKRIQLKETELIKLISRVINEEETDPIKDDHPTEPIVTFPLCCLWFCSECGFIWW